MSLSGKQTEDLVRIVRQHAIYFGGGISSDDAKVRDQCDALISSLEREGRAGRGGAAVPAAGKVGKGKAGKGKKPAAASPRPGGKPRAVGKTPSRAAAKIALPLPLPIPLKGRSPSKPSSVRVGAEILAEAARKPAPQAKAAAGRAKITAVKAGKAKKAGKAGKPPGKGGTSRAGAQGQTPAVRVPSATEPAATGRQRRIEAVHLFDAYNSGTLPKYGGYIISSSFDSSSSYAIFDLVGYDNVQEIFLQSDSLVFKSAGCRLYAMVEPAGYAYKNVEPNSREEGRKIPYRFKELDSLKTKKMDTVYVGKKPFISYSTFTVVKPQAGNFSILFYNVPSVFQNMQDFLIPVLNQRLGIPKPEALRASKKILDGILTFRIWLDL